MKECLDCKQLFDDALSACPNCGCPSELCQSAPSQGEESDPVRSEESAPTPPPDEIVASIPPLSPAPQSPVVQPSGTNPSQVAVAQQFDSDWAHYIYECGVIAWHTFSEKYVKFDGRATRREFWSFILVPLSVDLFCPFLFPIVFIITLLPTLAVMIRRLHDGNHNGWWCCVPFVAIFYYLQKSDKDMNDYGKPDNNLGI